MKQPQFPRMHISLYVSNIEATVDFYQNFFQQTADKVKSDYAKFTLDQPALVISFVQNQEKVEPKFGHLGFQVETLNDLMKKRSIIEASTYALRDEMGTNCCYALQDKFWVADPDGHQWEVYYFHQDVEFNDPHYSNESAEACCTPPPAATATKPKIKLAELNSSNCAPGSGCC